ncbi:MAG: type II secretion system GspH family protein [Aquificaceae bacterium]|nr:type II secretion system GspH family protein [Aquificaceae bacterium]
MKCFLPLALCPLGKKGLTLIELVLVIGIISILTGIIWIAYVSVQKKAYVTHCINNLRQIHLILQMYRQDYSGVEAEIGKQMKYWELGLPLHKESLKTYSRTSFYCPLVYSQLKAGDSWMVGYRWAVWEGKALGERGPIWENVIAQRGEEFPISTDCNHNPHGDEEAPWRLTILLRLNGKVETKNIWVLGKGSHEW